MAWLYVGTDQTLHPDLPLHPPAQSGAGELGTALLGLVVHCYGWALPTQ